MGPLFYTMTRLRVRQALRAKGLSVAKIRDAVEDATDEVIDAARGLSNIPVKAIGDGTLLDLLTKFFESALGKALIAKILELLGL
jgi:hypothetical protein